MASQETKAPGLCWRKRKGGGRTAYWTARPALIKAGFRPRTVRLAYDPENPDTEAHIQSQCAALHARMVAWASDHRPRRSTYDGTFATLVKLYETDDDSPYQDLRPNTQKNYSKHLRLLMEMVGTRYVRLTTGADTRRWYKKIAGDDGAHASYAYLLINLLKIVVSWGASERFDGCAMLRAEMTAARFQNGAPRKSQMTYSQARAFREAAHRMGKPSMALGVTLQRELAFRQRDVIGEWIEDETADAAIKFGRRVWRDGLVWTHIGTDGILRKATSKTGALASHRIADYPDLEAELARVPPDRRVGPIVIHEQSGMPYTGEQYRRWYRIIADAAGIPKDVQNRDARAGAVTEAYEAGATTEEAMALATHTQASTSRKYLREVSKQSSRAAKLRVAGRTEP